MPPTRWFPPAACRDVNLRSVGLDTLWTRLLLCSLLRPLGVSGPPWVQRALQRGLGGDGWGVGAGAGAEPAGEEKEALQFGLVFVAWALAPGVEWPRLAPAPALGCHRRPRWRWTGRHLAALPGPGRAGGSAWALHTARSSGWASAVLPGCLLESDAAAK